jgi:hypothetical protein
VQVSPGAERAPRAPQHSYPGAAIGFEGGERVSQLGCGRPIDGVAPFWSIKDDSPYFGIRATDLYANRHAMNLTG